MCITYSFRGINDNDNDNDKRLGLTAKAYQPDHKKYSTLKIKIDNEAVQKLHTNYCLRLIQCGRQYNPGCDFPLNLNNTGPARLNHDSNPLIDLMTRYCRGRTQSAVKFDSFNKLVTY